MSTAKPKLTAADSHPAPPQPVINGHPPDGIADGRNGSRPDLAPSQPLADGANAKPTVDRKEGYRVQGTKAPRPTLEALLKLVQNYYSDVGLEPIRKAYAYAEESHRG